MLLPCVLDPAVTNEPAAVLEAVALLAPAAVALLAPATAGVEDRRPLVLAARGVSPVATVAETPGDAAVELPANMLALALARPEKPGTAVKEAELAVTAAPVALKLLLESTDDATALEPPAEGLVKAPGDALPIAAAPVGTDEEMPAGAAFVLPSGKVLCSKVALVALGAGTVAESDAPTALTLTAA